MVTLKINGKLHQLDVPADMPVLWALRDGLGMTGRKCGWGMALCGACTVQLEGQAIRSCVTRVSAAAGKTITTIEAIGDTPAGKKAQEAWIALDVPQCGYCQSGQIMSASALLASNAHPTDADIDAAMAGNICRCGTYGRVRAAIKQAAQGAPIGGEGARPRPPDFRGGSCDGPRGPGGEPCGGDRGRRGDARRGDAAPPPT